MGQVELRFRQAHELDRPGRGVGHQQRLRVGHAHVLAGQYDEAPGDEPGILAGFEHPGQPIKAGVGIRPPDALYERADDVVVLVVAVLQRPGAAGRLDVGGGNDRVPGRFGQGQRHLEAIEGGPGVAIDEARQEGQGIRLRLWPFPAPTRGAKAPGRRPQTAAPGGTGCCEKAAAR